MDDDLTMKHLQESNNYAQWLMENSIIAKFKNQISYEVTQIQRFIYTHNLEYRPVAQLTQGRNTFKGNK